MQTSTTEWTTIRIRKSAKQWVTDHARKKRITQRQALENAVRAYFTPKRKLFIFTDDNNDRQ